MDDDIEPTAADEPPASPGDSPASDDTADQPQVDQTAVQSQVDETGAQAAGETAEDRPATDPWPDPPAASGLPAVDAAVERLGSVEELPAHAHVEVYDDAQRRLHDALAELDDEQ